MRDENRAYQTGNLTLTDGESVRNYEDAADFPPDRIAPSNDNYYGLIIINPIAFGLPGSAWIVISHEIVKLPLDDITISGTNVTGCRGMYAHSKQLLREYRSIFPYFVRLFTNLDQNLKTSAHCKC